VDAAALATSMDAEASAALARRLAAAGLDWIVPRWRAPANVHALMTTRNGGVSTGAAESLDLGGVSAASPSEADAVAENRRRVQAFLPGAPAWLEQVHGARVVTFGTGDARDVQPTPNVVPLSPAPSTPHWPRADAAVTRAADVVLAVRAADCLPVLFCDRDGAVAAIAHAGWRGLAAGVLENTVAAMQCDPARILAWLGAAIGPSAFEVGADVRDAFVGGDPAAEIAFVARGPGKWHADLEALARLRLSRAGVASIEGGGMCTASDPDRFFSYRRERGAGRMGAFIWRAPPMQR
jgi:YfiH family protein